MSLQAVANTIQWDHRPGNVRADEIRQVIGRRWQQPCERLNGGRYPAKQVAKDLRARGDVLSLQLLGRLGYGPEAGNRIAFTCRRLNEQHGDTVSEVPALILPTDVDRRQYAHIAVLGTLAVHLEVASERSGEDREHDVVDCAAAGSPNATYLSERELAAGQPALFCKRLVERCPRYGVRHVGLRCLEATQRGTGTAFAREHRVDSTLLEVAQAVKALGHVVEDRVDKAARRGWNRRVSIDNGWRRGRRRVRRHVKDDHQQFDPRDAVHEAVVHLRDHRRPVPFEPFDLVDLPQRLVAVEHAFEKPRRERHELRICSRRVQLDAHDMAVQVKAGVPFPGRMADIERRRHYPLLVTRDEVDLRCDVLDEALVRYSTLEDRYRADVQGRFRPLHVEERRVLRTQAPFVIVLGHRRFPSPGRAL